MAKRRGEEGTVVLRVFVNADGLAEKVQIRSSSGYELLDRAAHDTLHQWRFVPARQGDQPVAAWVLVPITFSLER
jgi:protein TonB